MSSSPWRRSAMSTSRSPSARRPTSRTTASASPASPPLAQARGIAALAKELLPALDNLDRALEEASAAGEDDALLQGVRLVRSELAAGLARVGIDSFSPLGEAFDPAVHEAVATMPRRPAGRPAAPSSRSTSPATASARASSGRRAWS